MKRTNLITYEDGKAYRVYEDTDGKLYYKYRGHICGTFPSYCEEGVPSKVKGCEYAKWHRI